jgi:hypothetical protein
MELSISDLFGIKAAHERLTSYSAESGNGQVVSIPYKFSGRTRYSIAKNLISLEKSLEPWEKVVLSLRDKYGISEKTKQSDENFLGLMLESTNLSKEQKEECELKTLPLAEFLDDKNPVPADVLGVLEKFNLLLD